MGMVTIAGAPVLDRLKARCDLDSDAEVGIIGLGMKNIGVDTESGNRDIEGVATTDHVDLDDEVVDPKGIDLSYFEKNNRRLFLDHCYQSVSVIGSCRYFRSFPNAANPRGWEFRARIVSISRGDDVLTIGREIGWGASIGFQVLEAAPPTDAERKLYPNAGRIIKRWKLLELSLTALPANVTCQASVSRVDETRAAALGELVTKGRIKQATAKLLGVETPKRRAVIISA